MRYLIKSRNFWIVFLGDALLLATAYFLAYCIRFERGIPEKEMQTFLSSVLWIVPIKIAGLWVFRLYRGVWRYAGVSELLNLAKAAVAASAAVGVIITLAYRWQGFSRGVFVIDFLLTVLMIGGFRFSFRLALTHTDIGLRFPKLAGREGGKRTLIVGAGDAGEQTLREIRENPHMRYRVVGMLDDDEKKLRRTVHNVPVLGTVADLKRVVDKHDVAEVLIAMPSATGAQKRRIVEACEAAHVEYKTIPGIGELIDGRVSIGSLRRVDFQDLLGRPAVKLDMEGISPFLKDKRVLVTGGAGSVGSELCRQIVEVSPWELVLFDASEPSLYEVQMELVHRKGYVRYFPVLGSVSDAALVERVFDRYRPHVVLHAAAYKHVPMLENHPWQAINNNVRGCRIVMEACIKYGTENFVLVSTDKAVRPTSVMGASKRLCERMMHALMGNSTRMMAVRFGNVLGSSGSVIPLFRAQIARGGPVTVTHPEITRYFMTIPEACKLILQAASFGKGGEIFVLEMGTPVKIADMARDVIRLSGKEPGTDIEIVYTGLRPGEKLYEELITEGEDILPTGHEKIMVLTSEGRWNDYESQADFRDWLMQGIEELYTLADAQQGEAIVNKLKELVPEFTPGRNECIL